MTHSPDTPLLDTVKVPSDLRNLAASQLRQLADELRAEFATLLGNAKAETVVHHCGSGVSAVPNVLAMEVAGLGRTALYAGSWSEWCNTPGLPCEKS